MGKEAKIGLGIVAILVIVLGVVVFRKVWGSKDLPDAAVEKPAVNSSEPGDGKSVAGGAMLIPASGDTNGADSEPFGSEVNRSRWVESADPFSGRPEDGSAGQPRMELMPKTGSSFGSGTQSLQGTDSQSEDRFGDPGLRQRDDFGRGGTN
ncbi:MAG: hypothetical protein IIA67_08675, partial [Planctomycetes bacterium]|nr:hypothetical protein [Planctomycetota bacterium]